MSDIRVRPTLLEMHRGDAIPLTIQVYKSDGKTKQNISGWTLRFTAKTDLSFSDVDAQIKKVSTDNTQIVIVDATTGLAQVLFLTTDTSSLSAKEHRFQWDLQGNNGAGLNVTLAYGTLIVYPDSSITVP